MISDKQYLNEIYQKYKEQKTSKSKEEFYNIKFKNTTQNILKLVATFIITIGISAGLVYATTQGYKAIWKEPQKYIFNMEITEEDKKECISQEEAVEKGNEILQKFGYTNLEIKKSFLSKSFKDNENEWLLYTNSPVSISIDGNTGDFKEIYSSTTGKDIVNNRSTKEEAIEVAKEMCNKYKLDNSEYELIKINGNAENEKDVYIWYATFYKKYNDLLNPYETISVAWIPKINELYHFCIENNKFENNPEEISKEQAIQIATNKHLQIQGENNITNIQAEKRIEKMNSEVYKKERGEEIPKEGEQYIYYETDNRVRLVWVVCLEYNVPKSTNEKENKYYSYYIDITTGEIIGGYSYNYYKTEKLIKNI